MHTIQYALLLAWLTNSPTVTIELQSYVMDLTKKNSQLLMFFMTGWTKYCLENNYSKDQFQGNLAGVKSIINIYKKGGLKKDKRVQKLVDLDEKGELEDWLKTQLP